ncbi:hypothetical protein EDB83DRAFT_2658183 [Lactarius deliciosus]|nr:hypothetical protein EDB83DRAFT_2658183 [Lactarius deliciosus]
MTKAPEPALSSLAWLVILLRFTAGDSLCRGGKTKVQEEEHKRKADGKPFCSCSTRSVRAVQLFPFPFPLNFSDRPGATREWAGTPEAPLHQDINASLSLRAAPTSARISPSLHAPVHLSTPPGLQTGHPSLPWLLDAGNSGIVNAFKRAKPGHTREPERWFNRPKAANSAPQIKTLRLTLGWFDLKKDLGTFRLPGLKVRGSEKGHLPERQDEPATGLMRATRLVEEESGGQAVRFVFVPDKEGGSSGNERDERDENREEKHDADASGGRIRKASRPVFFWPRLAQDCAATTSLFAVVLVGLAIVGRKVQYMEPLAGVRLVPVKCN